MAIFQPEYYAPQISRVVPLIESQYDYYPTPPPQQQYAPPQQQTTYPATLPITPGKNNTLTIVLIVGLLGFFTVSLLAFLAYMKR
jgi:hypothetical protein